MVSAWATLNHISLGQVVTDEKSNEITAIPKLLKNAGNNIAPAVPVILVICSHSARQYMTCCQCVNRGIGDYRRDGLPSGNRQNDCRCRRRLLPGSEAKSTDVVRWDRRVFLALFRQRFRRRDRASLRRTRDDTWSRSSAILLRG